MSVAGKKPFVNKIIERCSKTRVSRIMSLLNNFGEPTLLSLYGSENALSDANKGVSYVTFKLEEVNAKTVNGILVYIDNDNCGLFAFNDDTGITGEFKIDPVHKTYTQIFEHLTVEELRQICGDRVADIEVGSIQAEDIDSETTPAGKVLTANGQGGASWGEKITDYLKKTEGARVWVLEDDFLNIEDEIKDYKIGDIIYSTTEGMCGYINDKGETHANIIVPNDNRIYSYRFENGHWTCNNSDEVVQLGTKLYVHHLTEPTQEILDDDEFISPYPNPLTSYHAWFECNNYYGVPVNLDHSRGTKLIWNLVINRGELMVNVLELDDAGVFSSRIDEEDVLYENITDIVKPL